MSGVSDWSQAEKELYALGTRAILDDLERQQREWRESWALDSTSTDERMREHNERMRQLEEDHKAWLARFINGDTNELAQRERQGASGGEPASPSAVPAGQPDLHAAELAREIKDMDMATYAKRRAELGVRSATSMDRLFREM